MARRQVKGGQRNCPEFEWLVKKLSDQKAVVDISSRSLLRDLGRLAALNGDLSYTDFVAVEARLKCIHTGTGSERIPFDSITTHAIIDFIDRAADEVEIPMGPAEIAALFAGAVDVFEEVKPFLK